MKKYISLPALAVIIAFAACNTSTETTETNTETPADTVAAKDPNLLPDNLPAEMQLTDAQKEEYTKWGIDITKSIPIGLKVGEMAPVFKSKDHKGNEVFLPDLYAEGPVVMIFYRGEWCPVCDRYLSNLQDSLKYLKAVNAKVLAVTPETDVNIDKTIEKSGTSIQILHDPNSQLSTAFRVGFFVTPEYTQKIQDKYSTSIAANNGATDAKLPVPATYIIDKRGKVRFVHFDPNYKNRASVQDMLTAIEALQYK